MQASAAHRAWQNLPYAEIDTIFGTGRILVLAPHPDDESLGCGGLIAACCQSGNPPLVVVLTDGTGSHPNVPAATLQGIRERETVSALNALCLTDAASLIFMRVPDARAPHTGPEFAATLGQLERVLAGCAAICAPWQHDPHCDHEAAHILAAAVAAKYGLRHVAYPVWGWTLPADTSLPERPIDGWRLDIARYLPKKRAAIAAHRSQQGGLIEEDPTGFHLPVALLDIFERPYEVFLRP